MPTNSINIDAIKFEATIDRLRYPKYTNLINYNNVPDTVQLEPAFKFANAGAGGCCKFTLAIGDTDVFFAAEPRGNPIWWDAAARNRPDFVCVRLIGTDFRTCRIMLDLDSWPAADTMVVLRIFCTATQGGAHVDDHDGVSITFIRPGGVQLDSGSPGEPQPVVSNIKLDSFTAGRLPVYDIFKPVPLPSGVSQEPAFRVSENRSTVDAKITLAPQAYVFRRNTGTGGDDVFVYSRSANDARPSQLSRIKAASASDLRSFQFSWKREPGDLPIVFGFYVPVDDPATGRSFYSDPILFHDPPPPGQVTD